MKIDIKLFPCAQKVSYFDGWKIINPSKKNKNVEVYSDVAYWADYLNFQPYLTTTNTANTWYRHL
jgi:hypothetical protein